MLGRKLRGHNILAKPLVHFLQLSTHVGALKDVYFLFYLVQCFLLLGNLGVGVGSYFPLIFVLGVLHQNHICSFFRLRGAKFGVVARFTFEDF